MNTLSLIYNIPPMTAAEYSAIQAAVSDVYVFGYLRRFCFLMLALAILHRSTSFCKYIRAHCTVSSYRS
jgi:hypothetical protein